MLSGGIGPVPKRTTRVGADAATGDCQYGEDQCAAKEYGRKELVLSGAEATPDDGDEPQECDDAERREVQAHEHPKIRRIVYR